MLRKKVLLLTYYWPPAAGPGVQRWLKFCKFLGEFDIEVTIITPENPSASNYDESLSKEIPASCEVFKTDSFEPFELYKKLKGKKKGKEAISVGGINLFNDKSFKQKVFNYIRANFFIPDARKGWNKFAFKEASQLLKAENFDAVITTGPPHSTHLVGKKIKDKFQLPWIADFRDPWTNIYYNKLFPRTSSTKTKDQSLENMVLKQADSIIVVSPGLKSEFEDRARRIDVIYNGFDQDDIPARNDAKGERFVISYVGNFKPNQNCNSFWKACKRLMDERGIQSSFEIRLTGNVDQTVKDSIKEFGVEDVVNYKSYVPHKEAAQEMVNSSALLFIIPQTDHNKLILTGKLFEYLASCTPLISIGPEKGNAAEIIEETGRGKMMDYKNEEAIFNTLVTLYDKWVNNEDLKLSMDKVSKYSREGMTEILADVINRTLV